VGVRLEAQLLKSKVGIEVNPHLANDVRVGLADLIEPHSETDVLQTNDRSASHVQDALTMLTRLAIEQSPLLCIHAGVVTGTGGLVTFPGRSGQGKTTLVAALLQRGWGYLSDEVLAVDRADLSVTPFPRPLALDQQSRELLGLTAHSAPSGGGEVLVRWSELGRLGNSGPIVDIVLSERGAKTRLRRAEPARAVYALLDNAFNHFRRPAESFAAVVRIVRTARVWSLTYPSALDAACALTDSMGGDRGQVDSTGAVPSAAALVAEGTAGGAVLR
jgi:serine kinase of HPr protein (carbohydrate metabolism regulator)